MFHTLLKSLLLPLAVFGAVEALGQCTANAGQPVSGCAGSTVTLGGSPSATGNGPFTYSWSPATGLSSTTVASPTLTIPASNTTYTLTITDSNGCTANSTVAVTVLPSPSALLTTSGPEQVSTFGGLTTFSICDATSSWSFSFTDQSAAFAGSTRTLNWGDGSPVVNPAQGWALSHTYAQGLHTLSYTVNYPNGCSQTAQYNVFLGTNPGGGISTDPNTNICTGGTLPFYINQVSDNSPGTTYIIDFGDGNSITLPHPPPAVVNHTYNTSSCGVAGGQYTVSFTAQNPCDATQGQIGPIRVSQTPQAQFTMNPQGTACVNQTVSFTAQNLGQQAPACAPPRHVWSITPAAGWTVVSGTLGNQNGQPGNPGLWTTGSNTLGVQFNTPGTYSITDLVGNTCGQDSQTQTICIEQPPVPAFTLTPTVGCAPLTSTTTNTSVSPNTCGTTYQWNVTSVASSCGSGPAWNFVGGTNASSFEPQFQFTQPGTYTVQLQATNSCGTFSVSQSVTVNAPPQVSVAPLSGICAGQCVNPSATVQPCGAPIDTYAWTFPGGAPANANTLSPGQVCFAAPGNPTISLTVTNACGSATANANLAIGTLPPVPVVSSNSPVCHGQTLSLSATPIPGVTFQWTGPGGFSSNQPSVTIPNVTAANSGTYTVVAVSGGCQGPPATVNVVVVAAPVVSVTPSSAAICNGQSATLTASGAGNYEWFIGGNPVATGPTLTTSPAVTTTYTVTGDVGGCPGSATVTVTVYQLPTVSAGPALTLCDQAIPITLNGTPAPGTWSGPNVTAGGVFTPVPGQLGVSTLTYTHTNANGCTNTSTVNITVDPLTLIATLGNDTSLCLGQVPVILPASPPGGTWVGAGPGGSFVPSTVGNFTVTYNYGTGTCATSDQMNVQVIPAAILTVPANFALCIDQAPVPLPATPVGGTWSGSGLTGPPTEFDPALVAPGQHVLTYTFADGTGCLTTAQTVATVNALPVVNAGPDQVLCDQPVPVQLTATPAGGTWSSTWLNVTPGGELTPDGLGTDVLTYSVTDANGCSASDQMEVEVVPVDNPANAGADDAFCLGDPAVQLVGVPAGGTWSGPQVTAGGLFSNTVPGTYTLTYSVGTVTCLTQDQVTLLVNDLPVVDAGTDISVCLDGGPQVLVATPAGGIWSGVGVDPVSGVFDPTSALPGGNPVTYSYTDPITGCSNSDNATVTVNPVPVAAFSHGPIACVGAPFSFTNNSTGAGSYSWDFGDGNTSNAISPAHSYTSEGTFTVTLTAGTGAGCSDVTTSTVTVWSAPDAQPTLNVNNGCGPLEVTFGNTSVGQGLSYVWNFGGLGTSTDAVPPAFTFPSDPFDAITYTVSMVATNVCGSDQLQLPITVIPTPTAVFGPNVNEHCAFSDVPFGNASYGLPDTFLWDFGNGLTSTSPGPIVTSWYPGSEEIETYVITLTVSNACGSSSAQQTITVVPNEVFSFFNADPVVGCSPLTVNLTQYSVGDTAWFWDFGDGNVSLLENPSHTFTQPGTYTIELSNFGCGFDQSTVDVTVLPGPPVSFTVAPAAVCANEPFTFTNTTSVPGGALWNFGDGNSSTLSNPTHAYASSGSYPVSLTVTAANNGCTSTAVQNVTVLTTPVASFEPVPGSGCINLQVAFQNNTTSAGFYQWDFGNGNTSAQPAPFHTYTVAGTYNVTLIAENLNGCSDTATAQVVAFPLPLSAFSLSAYASCTSPVSVQTLNGSQGAIGYAWDLGNGETSELNNPEITFAQPGSYDVQLTATNQFGCTHTSTQQFVVHPTPLAAFAVEPQPGCAGRPVVFVNNSQNAQGFQWWLGDGTVLQADGPQHTYSAAGSYDVVLVATGAGGCTDTLTVPAAVIIHPSPIADFSTDTLLTLDNAIRFNNLSQGAVAYLWDFGDNDQSTAMHPVHLFPGDGGGYTVCLRVENSFGCPDTVCRFIAVPGDPQIYVPNTFTPNGDGLNDVFFPVLNGFNGWNYRLLIFDRWGELIHEVRDRSKGWDGRARGKDSQIDVYVWRVILEREGDAREFTGHVNLLR